MAPTVADDVAMALSAFARALTSSFSLAIPGQPEDQLKSPVTALLTAI